MDEIIAHQWKGNKLSFLVQWNLGDTTWEPYTECKDLEAVDRYLEILGINNGDWKRLPKKASEVVRRLNTRLNTNGPAVQDIPKRK